MDKITNFSDFENQNHITTKTVILNQNLKIFIDDSNDFEIQNLPISADIVNQSYISETLDRNDAVSMILIYIRFQQILSPFL